MASIDDQKKIIGENIKAARKAKGLTQRALAEKLGIAFQNLSVWENGKGSPSAKYLMKLSEVLNISLDQLTSTDGIKASLEKSFPSEGKFTGMGSETSSGDLQKNIEAEMPRIVQQEVAESASVKLMVRYLEEIIGILKKN